MGAQLIAPAVRANSTRRLPTPPAPTVSQQRAWRTRPMIVVGSAGRWHARGWPLPVSPEVNVGRTLLTNCAVVDATGRERLPDAAIAVEGNRLIHVGPRANGWAEPAADDHQLDLGGATVMPGLMDMHTHLSLVYPVGSQPPGWRETIPWQIARNAERALHAGVTLCRTTGEADHLDLAFKRAVEASLARGPRLVCGGPRITPTGGHGSNSPWYVETDGPEGFREAARRELKAGADHLKLMLTMGIGVAPRLRGVPRISASEARAVADAAHAAGRRVCAHNGGAEGAKVAGGARRAGPGGRR